MIPRRLATSRPVILPSAGGLGQRSQQCITHPWTRLHKGSKTRIAPSSSFRPTPLSPEATALAKRGNIGLPTDAKYFRPQKPEFLLEIKVCKRHTFLPWHMKYLERKGHPLADMFLSLYSAKQKQEPLWWLAMPTMDGSKAIVREKAMARVRKAFRIALRQNGYDKFGRRLVVDETVNGSGRAELPGNGDARVTELYGTLMFRVKDCRGFMKLELPSVVGYLGEFIQRVKPTLEQEGKQSVGR